MGGRADAQDTLVDPAIFERSATTILFVSLVLTIALGAQLFPNLPDFAHKKMGLKESDGFVSGVTSC